MNPITKTQISIGWNGGRNGWLSFLVGLAVIPHHMFDVKVDTTIHVYLGLWVLTIAVPNEEARS